MSTAEGEDGVRVEFMQDAAPTGTHRQPRPNQGIPAGTGVCHLLRLQPGDGDNPAVEGEDFDGEPILVLLNQGEHETIVTAGTTSQWWHAGTAQFGGEYRPPGVSRQLSLKTRPHWRAVITHSEAK